MRTSSRNLKDGNLDVIHFLMERLGGMDDRKRLTCPGGGTVLDAGKLFDLVLKVGVESNIASEGDKSQSGRKEGRERSK